MSQLEIDKMTVTGYGTEFCDGYGMGIDIGISIYTGFGSGKSNGKNHPGTSFDKDFQYAGR